MTLQERPKLKIECATKTPVLTTARLVLRAPIVCDVPAIAALLNDIRVSENTARIPHPYSDADAQSFVASLAASNETAFVITLRDGTLIGGCGITYPEGATPEIGYWFGFEHWGQGYATEAVQAVIDYAFDELELEALAAGARVSNPRSRRVLEKCGFQWTSVALYRIRALATSAPVDRFRLDRGIWASLKQWGQKRRIN